MSFRTVVISQRSKLDFSMNYLVIRTGENTQRIRLDDIALLMVENPAISLTGCLLEALVKAKVRVVFCDGRHNPISEISPLYGSHDCVRKLRFQLAWKEETKKRTWKLIIQQKIGNQALLLKQMGKLTESKMLLKYAEEVTDGDETNREGHAAKVYFNAIFGLQFSRNQENAINSALNYGYSLILSCVNREVVSCGYLTQLGIFHDNTFNQFNLSCDLMEPFRPLVDRAVAENVPGEFTTETKRELLTLLECQVLIDGAKQLLPNAIKRFVQIFFEAMGTDNPAVIFFPVL